MRVCGEAIAGEKIVDVVGLEGHFAYRAHGRGYQIEIRRGKAGINLILREVVDRRGMKRNSKVSGEAGDLVDGGS